MDDRGLRATAAEPDPAPSGGDRPGARAMLLVVAALALVWFGALEMRGLFWPDEGRYAEIAREMAVSGDWVTPRLNGLKYFEKPPLQYWATAVAFRLFGPDEWTARLWPATTGFLLVVVSGGLWWRWRGPEAGIVAAAAPAGAWGLVIGGQVLTLDMGLTLFLSLALLAFIAAESGGRGARWWRVAHGAMWIALALAVLCKGFIGVVLPALALVAYAVVERDARIVLRAFSAGGIAIFLAIALPWFVAVQLRNPEFFDFFVVGEHFRRFAESGHARAGAWWYFVPVVLAGLLPWTAALPGVARDAWNAPRSGGLRVGRLLLLWAAAVVVFFSVSRSKLPPYVLPALPALAWLVATASGERLIRIARSAAVTGAIGGGVLVGVALQLERFAKVRELGIDVAAYRPWLVAAGLVLVAGCIAVHAMRRRWMIRTQLAALAAINLVAMQLSIAGLQMIDAYYSAERTVETFVPERSVFPRRAPFYSVEMLDQSVPFYLGRPVTMVAYRGELAPGIAAEPEKFVPTREAFVREWVPAAEAYAVMPPSTHRELVAQGVPMTVMASDPRRVFVARGTWPLPAGSGRSPE